MIFAIILATIQGATVQDTSSKLSRLFDLEMFSTDLAYFEQVTRPAWRTFGDSKTYKVDGCEVV